MSVRSLLSALGKERGITIEPDELDALGLSDDDETTDLEAVDLSLPLPGRASAQLEVFLAAGSTKVEPLDEGGLIWEPIMRAGQWALRPDGKGGKKRLPLKIVAGHSTDQHRQIGLADVEAAFNDGAVEHVTVPETHENKATQNHGYIEKVKIVKGRFKGEPVDVFMGGYNFTEPDTRAKVLRGSVPSRSAGLLYDYERTDTGKSYPVALEHVALTPKPWLRGMPRFGRALEAMSEDVETIALTLSDEGPSDEEYEIILSEPGDLLADAATVSWSHEDSPQWLQEQVNNILRAKRTENMSKRRSNPGYMVEDSLPCYRAVEAKPGSALVADGYGDGANYWVAPITVVDGEVQVADVARWNSTKKVWVADTRPVPTGDKAPLSDDAPVAAPDPLKLAQDLRRARGVIDSTNLAMTAAERSKLKPKDHAVPGEMKFPIHTQAHARNALARAAGTTYEKAVKKAVKKRYPSMNIKPDETPRGGGNMADPTSAFQLSDEARQLIQAAEAKAQAAEERATSLAETVDRLVGTVNGREADAFIVHMKTPAKDGGLGLSEERGFSGMLREVHAILLADDGGPAVQSDHFADDRNKEGTLSVTDAFKRVFGALRTKDGSTLQLGEVVKPPSELKEGEELNTKGKPGKGDEEVDETNLSDDELLKGVPDSMLAGLGLTKPGAEKEKMKS